MFPFIRQHYNMQCGVACLAMICKNYGVDYSIKALSEICNTGQYEIRRRNHIFLLRISGSVNGFYSLS